MRGKGLFMKSHLGWIHPAEKLSQLKKASGLRHRGLLGVVVYVNQRNSSDGPSRGVPTQTLVQETLADAEAAFAGGADAAVLIDEWASRAELEACVAAVRERHPDRLLGVNFLGSPEEPYGYQGAFEIAERYGLQWVWTDFSGVDLIEEREEVSLHTIEAARLRHFAQGFYVSGVHMKYSTLKDPAKTIEQSALQAMGFVDGVVVTGLKTGAPTDPEAVRRVKRVVGDYPVGVASGTSPENVGALLGAGAEFFLVASAFQNAEKRVERDKVRAMVERMR